MKIGRNTIAAALLLSAALCPGVGCKQSGPAMDPLQEKAQEKYAEGRRLFLTCDPNNYNKAAQLFQDALAYWEEYPEAMAAWSETVSMWYGFMLPEEVFQEAYMKAQRAIRINPELTAGYRAMADLFRHRKNPDTGTYDVKYALDVIERAIAIDPNNAENLYVKGSIYLSIDPEMAIEILEKAINLNPNLGKIYFNLASANQSVADGMFFQNQDKPEELEKLHDQRMEHYNKALEMLRTYQQMVPGDLGGYTSMGIIYLRLEDFDKAVEEFKKSLSANPNPDPSQQKWRIISYYNLANLAFNKDDDPEAARIYLERGLEKAPNHLDMLNLLVQVTKKLGDEKATKQYEERINSILEKKMQEKEEAPGNASGSTVSGGE